MTIILPYDKKFETAQGGFVKPNGEILFSSIAGNEKTAMEYCNGPHLEELRSLITDRENGIFTEYDYYLYSSLLKKYPDFEEKLKQFGEYASTNLTKEELELYKKWIFVGDHRLVEVTTDYMKYILGFDVVYPAWLSRRVLSPDMMPFTKWYNYALMDWHIIREEKKHWDDKSNGFKFIENEETLKTYYADKEVEEGIMALKRVVPLEERHKFFRTI